MAQIFRNDASILFLCSFGADILKRDAGDRHIEVEAPQVVFDGRDRSVDQEPGVILVFLGVKRGEVERALEVGIVDVLQEQLPLSFGQEVKGFPETSVKKREHADPVLERFLGLVLKQNVSEEVVSS